MPVMMINNVFAEKYFANQNPIGQRINIGDDPKKGKPAREVIGVVGSAKHQSLAETERPEFYIPYAQDPDRYSDIVVRTAEPAPSGLETAIRHVVHEVDAQQFMPAIKPLPQLISQTLAQSRFNTTLLGAFAAVAIILAAVGIYGVIAYNVAQRTKEIGIRMALGAQREEMLRMILRQSMWLVLIGVVAGIAAALLATRVLSNLLYGVGPNDLSTYLLVVLLLAVAALIASYIPARRAMAVDPMIALRYE
jgi:putative ABC transport system permease protein